MPTDTVALGEPLALVGQRPVVYPALGAVLHLERMEPSDEARLEAVNDLVWDWFGDRLRWVNRTFDNMLDRAQRSDLDYIAGYPTSLDVPPTSPQLNQDLLAAYTAFTRDDFGIHFSGGEVAGAASPYSYRFWVETAGVSDSCVDARGVLHITVPEAWPLEDFRQRIVAIASALRLRWGAAGYTYATWRGSDIHEGPARTIAHARRYPGYDLAEYVRLVNPFFERIRTVSWMTFVGGALVGELKDKGRTLVSSTQISVEPAGDGLLVQAGNRPERGDVNRLLYPSAYLEADALLRPVRARDGRDMVFFGSWQEPEITDWLCRFERAVN
jgi:Protein of unknown function (DUF3396)